MIDAQTKVKSSECLLEDFLNVMRSSRRPNLTQVRNVFRLGHLDDRFPVDILAVLSQSSRQVVDGGVHVCVNMRVVASVGDSYDNVVARSSRAD